MRAGHSNPLTLSHSLTRTNNHTHNYNHTHTDAHTHTHTHPLSPSPNFCRPKNIVQHCCVRAPQRRKRERRQHEWRRRRHIRRSVFKFASTSSSSSPSSSSLEWLPFFTAAAKLVANSSSLWKEWLQFFDSRNILCDWRHLETSTIMTTTTSKTSNVSIQFRTRLSICVGRGFKPHPWKKIFSF